ncbi:CGH_3_collapsed_G0015080.mRNA.1.CDS.1 [Saccharomyces cerevisiae]|nr:CGH_3_collapsed_G0015080.mRNA.1.CDS.1 [Saccharomyces cerevisiae]
MVPGKGQTHQVFYYHPGQHSSTCDQKNVSLDYSAGSNHRNYITSIEDFEDLSQINSFNSKWNQLIIAYKNVLHKEAYVELLSVIVD